MPTLVLATTNPGKVAEFRTLLAQHLDLSHVALTTPKDLGLDLAPIEETGETFAENARLKAVALAEATGRPSLADDSGLCLDALGGAPGLFSARWAGDDLSDAERTARLLEVMRDVPVAERTGRFVCAAAVATQDGRVWVEEGICEGVLLDAPRGENGFGYDPVFLLPALGRTMAELTPDEKNRLSHRAVALARLAPALHELFVP